MSNPTALSYLAGRVATLEGTLTSMFVFKGQVPLVADLPSSGNSAGDAYIVQEDDSFQVWNGTEWISGGSIGGIAGTNGTNGENGADGNGIESVSYVPETGDLTITLTDTTSNTFNVKGENGTNGENGLDGNGIDTVVYASETGVLTITMTNTDVYGFDVKGADGADADLIVRVSADSLVADAITDAWDDHIGVLASVASNTDLVLPTNGGATTRVDGKMLRFFCNAAANDSHHYLVKEDGGSTIFQIHGQEAYTMIWREATTDWLVVPGILNAKSKPAPV